MIDNSTTDNNVASGGGIPAAPVDTNPAPAPASEPATTIDISSLVADIYKFEKPTDDTQDTPPAENATAGSDEPEAAPPEPDGGAPAHEPDTEADIPDFLGQYEALTDDDARAEFLDQKDIRGMRELASQTYVKLGEVRENLKKYEALETELKESFDETASLSDYAEMIRDLSGIKTVKLEDGTIDFEVVTDPEQRVSMVNEQLERIVAYDPTAYDYLTQAIVTRPDVMQKVIQANQYAVASRMKEWGFPDNVIEAFFQDKAPMPSLTPATQASQMDDDEKEIYIELARVDNGLELQKTYLGLSAQDRAELSYLSREARNRILNLETKERLSKESEVASKQTEEQTAQQQLNTQVEDAIKTLITAEVERASKARQFADDAREQGRLKLLASHLREVLRGEMGETLRKQLADALASNSRARKATVVTKITRILAQESLSQIAAQPTTKAPAAPATGPRPVAAASPQAKPAAGQERPKSREQADRELVDTLFGRRQTL